MAHELHVDVFVHVERRGYIQEHQLLDGAGILQGEPVGDPGTAIVRDQEELAEPK